MRILRVVAVLGLTAALGSCVNPRVQTNMAQTIMDMTTAVQDLQQDMADASARIDSLQGVVAHQDTLIQRLATLTQVPWPPPRD